jgi:membrane protease YdiL (CAAX protease family)
VRAFGCFLGLLLTGFGAMAAFAYPAWAWLHPHFGFPFHRVGERIGMLALALGLGLAARPLGLTERADFGFGIPRRRFLAEMSIALALGVVSMVLVVGLMTALGLLDWSAAEGRGAADLAKIAAAGLASALAVAFVEETFLRGAMQGAIERESGPRAAVLLTAVVYAATHFFASHRIPDAQVTAWSGVALVTGTLELFSRPAGIADAFLCLFAVGVVLGAVRAATGNIAACVGLHAGWVWVMLTVHGTTQPLRSAPLGFLLSRFDGFTGWLVLAWTIPVGLVLQRFYAGRGAGGGPSGSAKGASASSR